MISTDAAARHNEAMAAISQSTRDSLTVRLLHHAGQHWPHLARVQVRPVSR